MDTYFSPKYEGLATQIRKEKEREKERKRERERERQKKKKREIESERVLELRVMGRITC